MCFAVNGGSGFQAGCVHQAEDLARPFVEPGQWRMQHESIENATCSDRRVTSEKLKRRWPLPPMAPGLM
jgi:hypothetical protein